jgi:hypothetical protein
VLLQSNIDMARFSLTLSDTVRVAVTLASCRSPLGSVIPPIGIAGGKWTATVAALRLHYTALFSSTQIDPHNKVVQHLYRALYSLLKVSVASLQDA